MFFSSRKQRLSALRRITVAILALALSHAPLPVADYHNIRHHDGPGEICEHHDHLIKLHPQAALASDVAVLHWHWLAPTFPDPGDSAANPAGPTIHPTAPEPDLPGFDTSSKPSYVTTSVQGDSLREGDASACGSDFAFAPPEPIPLRTGPAPPCERCSELMSVGARLARLQRFTC